MRKLTIAVVAGVLSFAFAGAYAGEADMKKDTKKGSAASSSTTTTTPSATTTTTTTTDTAKDRKSRPARATKG